MSLLERLARDSALRQDLNNLLKELGAAANVSKDTLDVPVRGGKKKAK